MDCDDLQRQLLATGGLDGAARAHADACPQCQAYVAVMRAMGPVASAPPAPDDGLRAATMAAIERDRGAIARARAWPTATRTAVAAAACLAVPLGVWLAMPRPDLAHYPKARLLLELLASLVTAGAAIAIWLRPLHRPQSVGTRLSAIVGTIAAAAILASLPEAHHAHPSSLGGVGAQLLPKAFGCFVFGSSCALPAWLGLRWLARDGDRPGARATLAAVGAAVVGMVAVFLHCPIVAHAHLWLGHMTVMLPLLSWAWFAARRR